MGPIAEDLTILKHAGRLYGWGAAAPQTPRSLLGGSRPTDLPVGGLPPPKPPPKCGDRQPPNRGVCGAGAA